MDLYEKISAIFVSVLQIDESEITEDSHVLEDLGADSLDMAEILVAVESEFDITVEEDDVSGLRTIGDIVNYISTRI